LLLLQSEITSGLSSPQPGLEFALAVPAAKGIVRRATTGASTVIPRRPRFLRFMGVPVSGSVDLWIGWIAGSIAATG
jgi:hypothetical protein